MGCPWDTLPVSRQKCQFYSKQQEIPGAHRPVDPSLSRVSWGHPAGVLRTSLIFMCPFLFLSCLPDQELRWGSKRDAKRGREEKRQKMSWQTGPFPLQPHFVRGPPPPLPLMFSEVQKKGELAREVRGSKDKTNGRERDAPSWHFLSRPLPGVPFWPSPRTSRRVQTWK